MLKLWISYRLIYIIIVLICQQKYYLTKVKTKKQTIENFMNIKPRRFNTNYKDKQQNKGSDKINNLTNDVSFSIPQWRQKQIKNINQQYEKQIYSAVQYSLTDFQSKQEVQFLSKPQKSMDQRYAYERNLINSSDFSILAFILCFQQLLIGESSTQAQAVEKFKKKISQLDLCNLTGIPLKMASYYENKVLKKILFQYINKGSYNVSLLEVLLRRNSVLKFSLSLVSKAILKKRGLITSYNQKIPFDVQMKNCGDQFGVLSTIKVKDKSIQTQNFYISTEQNVKLLRKQNIVQIKKTSKQKSMIKRSQTPPDSSSNKGSKILSSKRTKQTKSNKQQQSQSTGKNISKEKESQKRSNSLANFFKKFICF